MVLLAVGVAPRTAMAKAAGLSVNRGIVVDECLRASAPDVYAAGDVAEWFDPARGQHVNVQHWVVAQRQGMTAARNILGRCEPFTAVPFFWSQHYDVTINYVGVAPAWDSLTIEGSVEGRDCAVRYWEKGRLAAVATVFRDQESLRAELEMERRSVR
jgi:NADPH-dependent 2,4-dienoyl-CoA reductase/sulfur reductase-like enzyme